jgi:hypothetical protein
MKALSRIHAEAVKLIANEDDDGTVATKLADLRVEAAKIVSSDARESAVRYPSILDANFEKRLLNRFEFAEHAVGEFDFHLRCHLCVHTKVLTAYIKTQPYLSVAYITLIMNA